MPCIGRRASVPRLRVWVSVLSLLGPGIDTIAGNRSDHRGGVSAWFKWRLQLRMAVVDPCRVSTSAFRGAKGDFTLTPAHATRETRNLNHAGVSDPPVA